MTPDEVQRLADGIARIHERIDGIEAARAERGETLAVLVSEVKICSGKIDKLTADDGPIAANARAIKENTDWRIRLQVIAAISGGALLVAWGAGIAEILSRL